MTPMTPLMTFNDTLMTSSDTSSYTYNDTYNDPHNDTYNDTCNDTSNNNYVSLISQQSPQSQVE